MSATFIAIVNYGTARLVVDCLASVAQFLSELRPGRVVIADNKSADDSVEVIRAAIALHGWSEWVELLALPRNGGFAYGNNAAIARMRQIDPGFDAVILLNPDTLVCPGAIYGLVEHLKANPEVGIVGASIEDASGATTISAHRQPSPWTELDQAAQLAPLSRLLGRRAQHWTLTAAHECDWVSGACMGIRREVLDAIGPMDEEYFLYFEEVDFCLRARRAGWACWFIPKAHVVHFEGASTGIRVPRRRRPGYWYDSRRRFFVKAYGIGGLVAADALWAIGRFTLVARRMLGLGGQSARVTEPTGMAPDLLGGDLGAIVRGNLRGVDRIA